MYTRREGSTDDNHQSAAIQLSIEKFMPVLQDSQISHSTNMLHLVQERNNNPSGVITKRRLARNDTSIAWGDTAMTSQTTHPAPANLSLFHSIQISNPISMASKLQDVQVLNGRNSINTTTPQSNHSEAARIHRSHMIQLTEFEEACECTSCTVLKLSFDENSNEWTSNTLQAVVRREQHMKKMRL